jgi:hypothetical protein
MDRSAEQRLAEVVAARRTVQRRQAAGVRVLLDQAAVRRVRIGWARWVVVWRGLAELGVGAARRREQPHP